MNRDQDREETTEEQAERAGMALERNRILGPDATAADASELATALRAYHQGTERGELRRLLVRLRGPSPSLHEQATAHLTAINDMERFLMVPNEDLQRPGCPAWASNREPNATPCERILAALVKVPSSDLEALAAHVERLAGWVRASLHEPREP